MRASGYFGPLLTLALTAAPLCAQTAEPLVMVPSSQWVADYADDNCALRRAFTAGDDHMILELRQFAPGDSFEVMLLSDTLERTRKIPRARFDPDDDWTEGTELLFADSGEGHGVIYTDSLRPAALKRPPTPEEHRAATVTAGRGEIPVAPLAPWPEEERTAREQAVTSLTVTDSFARPVTLQTGHLHQPMEALRTCMDELLTHWGVDPVALRTASHPVSVRPSRIVENYPAEMVRQRKSARVQIRIIIGKDGKPTACMPVKGRVDPAFEEAACDGAMRYSRFQPTVDANGQPIANFFATTIVYQFSR